MYRLWEYIDGGGVLPGQKCIPYIAGGSHTDAVNICCWAGVRICCGGLGCNT